MNELLLLGTTDGVVSCRRNGATWVEAGRGLAGRDVNSVVFQSSVVLAGTTQGIFRLEKTASEIEQGQLEPWVPSGEGVHTPYLRRLAIYPGIAGFLLAGTEPANIFLSYDHGLSWRTCPEVAQMREQFDWSLPYSPRAGAVRSFAFEGQRVYAAVEDGGVLVSNTSGETWRLAEGSLGWPEHNPPTGFVHSDVHSLEVPAQKPGTIYAATGGGLYRSEDRGERWQRLTSQYCRALWIDPEGHEHLILGPAEGVDANGRIVESRDAGQTWQPAMRGLEGPWPETMVERFVAVNEQLLAILSNGEILVAALDGLSWEPFLTNLGRVNDAAVFAEG